MNDYPNYMSGPIHTSWGDFEIAVRTGAPTFGSTAGQYVGAYQISKGGNSLANHSVPTGFDNPRAAAENALWVAKEYARQSLEGPFPDH
jgi:hypothetical protein